MKYTIKSSRKVSEKKYRQAYDTLLLVFAFFPAEYVLYDGEKLKSFVLEIDGEFDTDDVPYVVGAVNGIFDTNFEVIEEEDEEEEE